MAQTEGEGEGASENKEEQVEVQKRTTNTNLRQNDRMVAVPTNDDDAGEADNVQIQVFFINGIKNTIDDSQSSLIQLSVFLNDIIRGQYNIAPLYNPSEGLVLDLVEVIQQKAHEQGLVGWQYISLKVVSVIQFVFSLPIYSVGSVAKFLGMSTSMFTALLDLFPDAERSLAALYAARASVIPQVNAPLVQEFVTAVKDSICSGYSVILIAHSQGNLFMNAVYESIAAGDPSLTKYLSLVPIATPAAYVDGPDSRYVTRTDDLVIGAVPGALTRNTVPRGSCNGDFLAHNLVNCYLNDRTEHAAISALVYPKIGFLQFPKNLCKFSFYVKNVLVGTIVMLQLEMIIMSLS